MSLINIAFCVILVSKATMAAPPIKFQRNIQCAHEISFLFNHDENIYVRNGTEPYFIFFQDATGLSRPLFLSREKVGLISKPKNIDNGFKMDDGCLKNKGKSWHAFTKINDAKKCPNTEISDLYNENVYRILRDQIVSRIKVAKQKLDEDIISLRARSGDRFPPSAGEVGKIMRKYLDALEKCRQHADDQEIKLALSNSTASIGTPPGDGRNGTTPQKNGSVQ